MNEKQLMLYFGIGTREAVLSTMRICRDRNVLNLIRLPREGGGLR